MLADILHEIPSLDNLPGSPTKEQRLEIILSNLERQRNVVRARIIASAKQELAALPADPAPDTSSPDHKASLEHLFASLEYVRTPQNDNNGQHPPPPPPPPADSIEQVEPPAQIDLAITTIRLLNLHDARCIIARRPYEQALQRLRGSKPSTDDSGEPKQTKQILATAIDPRRRSSGVTGVGASSDSRRQSSVDESRDPRRR